MPRPPSSPVLPPLPLALSIALGGLLSACEPPSALYPTGDVRLSTDAESLDFSDTPYGFVAQQTIAVSNSGAVAAIVSLSIDGDGYSLDRATLTIPSGGDASLAVSYLPPSASGTTGALTLTPQAGAILELPLSATTDDDGDDDGDAHAALGGGDCDDADASAHSGASEIWYDGVDQDCDGADDYDADADGYQSAEHGASGAGDCDDQDPGAYPGASEVWYDGADSDCDGASDYDADRDGHDADAHGGDDCDDADPRVSPSDDEIWYDGVDQDCDGASDYDADADGWDADEWTGGGDCDDDDAGANPDRSESDDGRDEDCDALIDEDFVDAGDLVINEILADPTQSSDALGQYVEIWNASDRDVGLLGWTLTSQGDSAIGAGDVVLPSGGYALWCGSDRSEDNGGLGCDLSWEGELTLDPDGGALSLSLGGLEVDAVDSAGWGVTPGAARSLDPGRQSASANDLSGSWCDAATPFGDGDLGTPGSANEDCD